MTELFNIRLEGSLTNLTPICVVGPNAEEIALPGGGGKVKKITHRNAYKDGIREEKPILPGSTIRGRLRRAAADVVLGLSEKGTCSLAEWHQNAIGGVKGSDKEGGYDVMVRERIRALNPLLALFGSGAPWMNGHSQVFDAIPEDVVQTEISTGARTDDARRDNALFEKLDASARDDWSALANANAERTEYKASIKKLEAEMRKARKSDDAKAIARIHDDIKDLKAKEAEAGLLATNSVAMPIAHQAMPAGVRMSHLLVLNAVTAEEAGLFFAALNLMFKSEPHFGQNAKLGYGLVEGEYDVTIESVRKSDPFDVSGTMATPVGTMSVKPVVGLSNVPEQIVEFMGAFRDAATSGQFDFSLAETIVAKPGKAA